MSASITMSSHRPAAIGSFKAFGLLIAALFCFGSSAAFGIEIKSSDDVDKSGTKIIKLQITGKFEPGDGLKIRAFIANLPSDIKLVAQLDGKGGIFSEAMSVGRFFHQLGVVTEVPPKAQCVTPCPLAFFGGYDAKGGSGRIKHTTATFGFSPVVTEVADKDYTVKDLDTAVAAQQRNVLNVMDYLIEVNADLDVLRRTYDQIPEGTVNYLSDEDLLLLGVSILRRQIQPAH